MSQQPLAVALLLCEQVIVDDKTRNLTPVNCFLERVLEDPLSERQTFHVFVVVTDGQGTMPAPLEIERLDTGEQICRKSFTLHLDTPLQHVRCGLRVRLM